MEVSYPTQTLATLCGPLIVWKNVPGSAYDSFFSFDHAEQKFYIDPTSSYSGSTPFVANLEFYIENDYITSQVPNAASIELFDCSSSVISHYSFTTNLYEFFVSSATSQTLVWEEFTFLDTLC